MEKVRNNLSHGMESQIGKSANRQPQRKMPQSHRLPCGPHRSGLFAAIADRSKPVFKRVDIRLKRSRFWDIGRRRRGLVMARQPF